MNFDLIIDVPLLLGPLDERLDIPNIFVERCALNLFSSQQYELINHTLRKLSGPMTVSQVLKIPQRQGNLIKR
jgi:hypothetical protein